MATNRYLLGRLVPGGKKMNKLLGSVAAAVLLAGAASVANAADMPLKAPPLAVPACPGGDIVRANNQVSADFVETYIDYGPEFLTGVGAPLDTEKGWVPGVRVTGSLMQNFGSFCNIYLMGSFTYLNGSTQYWASGGPVTANTDGATVNNFDFRIGKGFGPSSNFMLTPYLGVGSNWWNRLLNGPFGYDEKYSHAYVGGGLLVQFSPAPRWVISADGLIGEAFDSSMTASPTPGGVAIPGLFTTFTLGNNPVYMVGASVDYAFTEHWHANAGVDYSYFSYGQSAPNAAGFLEPNSTTSYTTVSIGVGYGW